MSNAPSSDYNELKSLLKNAKNIVVVTGAGVSAESGIPTFRGSDGLWRNHDVMSLATPAAFKKSPSLVWEFHHFGRELILSKLPNKAHIALAKAEEVLAEQGRRLTIITQNVDGLHQQAGSVNVIELHGSLFKTLCLDCKNINYSTKSPICPALAGRGSADAAADAPEIPLSELPRCEVNSCNGLLRPYTVWFGESLDPQVLQTTGDLMKDCDLCLVIGTSSVVYPAAMFAPALAMKGVPVAEFNTEATPATNSFRFHFEGPCGQTVPEALIDLIGGL